MITSGFIKATCPKINECLIRCHIKDQRGFRYIAESRIGTEVYCTEANNYIPHPRYIKYLSPIAEANKILREGVR